MPTEEQKRGALRAERAYVEDMKKRKREGTMTNWHGHPDWQMMDSRMTMEHLGLIPFFLMVDDPRSAREQFEARYISGWNPTTGFKMSRDHSIRYPGDPPLRPLAMCKLRDETIFFYRHSWVVVVQRDGSYEACRMD